MINVQEISRRDEKKNFNIIKDARVKMLKMAAGRSQ